MNPWSNHQIGQATHREYEARYGSRYLGDEIRHGTIRLLSPHMLALALSGLSVTGVIIGVSLLF